MKKRGEDGHLSWSVVEPIPGLTAKRAMTGRHPGRTTATILIGIAGVSVGSFNVWSLLVATLEAGILLSNR